MKLVKGLLSLLLVFSLVACADTNDKKDTFDSAAYVTLMNEYGASGMKAAYNTFLQDGNTEWLYSDLSKIDGDVTLVGGGIGVPPMLLLAKKLKEKEIEAKIVLGFRDESFLVNDFKALGLDVVVCTDSGREGYHGNTVAYLRENNINSDIYCACGPKPMLKFLSKYAHECGKFVYLSMEERMGCGYGACVGCVIDIYDENHEVKRKKVCKDGPVFDSREVVWDE